MTNLIAHRSLDSDIFKENTINAIDYAFKKDYIRGVEIDVRITKDNKIVVIHDSTINRTSDGMGFVKDMSLKKLKKYNFGTKDFPSKICTLKDVLKIKPFNKILLIEIKCFNDELNFIKHFYNTIKHFSTNNLYIMSFNKEIVLKIKKLHPNLKCGLLINKVFNNKLNESFDFFAISSYKITQIKEYNKPVFIWNLRNVKRYDELEAKMPPDTFYIVDYPKKFIN